jgi:cytochrome c oxidase cbb3-type subunit 2
MSLKMTGPVIGFGSFAALIAVIALVVFLPTFEAETEPSDIWRPLTAAEKEGEQIYKENGCQYCHSMYVRAQDTDYGQNRVSQAGDYFGDEPPLLGSERQGPDMAQEGGLRSNDWHFAHFVNPRFTRPESNMPPFLWLGDERIKKLTAYVQSRGLKMADPRMKRQEKWGELARTAYAEGAKANMEWLHNNVPKEWMDLPNPYSATKASIMRGEKIYAAYCLGCHGPVGDGMGPAAKYLDPVPYNFTFLKNREGNIGGMFYYQIMNGITGTSMPAFKGELESEKIWDVSNYVAVYFVGRSDTENGPLGIPASYEEPRHDEVEVEGEK